MRLVWGSNSPFSGSGYGVQTNLVTPRLKALGHDVGIASNYGTDCWMAGYEGMPVYPSGAEAHSVKILWDHADHFQADAVVTHYDAWVYEPEAMNRPWIPWFPIDTDALSPFVEDRIKHAALRVTQTRHGQAACDARGLACEYVPASFSKDTYYPVDGRPWREGAGLGDRFVALMVAANKGAPGAPSRKSFAQAFQGFKLFLESEPDALLYIHTLMHGHLNLPDLAAHCGIQDNIAFAHPYQVFSGLVSGADMRTIYSAADVLLSPSMGEGFGVPILEAQACGTPAIVGDWTAMSEINRSGVKIPKRDAVRHPVQHGNGFYGDMFIVRPEAVRDALVAVRGATHAPDAVAAAVAEYEVDTVFAEHWRPVVEKIEGVVGQRSKAVSLAEAKRARKAAKRRTIQGAPMPDPAPAAA